MAQHGHFIPPPEDLDWKSRYEPLRVPASPAKRDFVVRRVKDPETGEIVTELRWNRPRYELPGLDEKTRQTGVTEIGQRPGVVDLVRDGYHSAPGTPGDEAAALVRERVRRAKSGVQRPLRPDLADVDLPELERRAKELLDLDECSLAGGRVEHLREAVSQLADLAEEWPEPFGRLKTVRFNDHLLSFGQTSEDGSRIDFGLPFMGGIDTDFAVKAGSGHVPPGCARPAAVATEEAAHALKIWLDGDPDVSRSIRAWQVANPLPERFGSLRQNDLERIDRRHHEEFVWGAMTWEHSPSDRSDPWVAGLHEQLARWIKARRNSG